MLRRAPKAFRLANLGYWSTDAIGAACLAEMQLSTRTVVFLPRGRMQSPPTFSSTHRAMLGSTPLETATVAEVERSCSSVTRPGIQDRRRPTNAEMTHER